MSTEPHPSALVLYQPRQSAASPTELQDTQRTASTTFDEGSPEANCLFEEFLSFGEDFAQPSRVEPESLRDYYDGASASQEVVGLTESAVNLPYDDCQRQLYGDAACGCLDCILSGPTEINEGDDDLSFSQPNNLSERFGLWERYPLSCTTNHLQEFVSLGDIEKWPTDENRDGYGLLVDYYPTDFQLGHSQQADNLTGPGPLEKIPSSISNFTNDHENSLTPLAPPNLKAARTLQSRQTVVDGHCLPTPRTRTTQQVGSGSLTGKKETNSVIKKWFIAHMTWPYPNSQEQRFMMEESGLSIRQVRRCLTNLRARTNWKATRSDLRALRLGSLSSSPQSGDFDTQRDTQSTNSIDRQLVLSSSSEPQSTARAAYTYPQGTLDESSTEDANSVSSPGTADGFGLSPLQPAAPREIKCMTGRKGKKPFILKELVAGPNTLSETEVYNPQDMPFQCTFCFKHLKDRYEWKRHEASYHVLATKWICMPENTFISNGSCVFCEKALPSPLHDCSQNIDTCLARSLDDRTFTRKDHLKQHIQQVHLQNTRGYPPNRQTNVSLRIPPSWRFDRDATEFDAKALWCGFCKTDLETWAQRVEHVSEHFQQGDSLTTWSAKFL